MEKELTLESQIEALLFYRGEAVKETELVKTLETSDSELAKALDRLETQLADRGLALIRHEGRVALGTHGSAHKLIEKITKEELMRDLGKAGLETLAIILYKHPVTRRDIDYIRGVNSSFILRNLLMRGLIERVDEKGGRGYAYKPTLDLLMHLGISKISDLPNYQQVVEELETFEKTEDNSQDNA